MMFMESLLFHLAEFGSWLLRSSWQASVLIVLVLLAQWVFRRQLAPRWRYALWLLVLIRLALPIAPESSWSVFNLAPESWAKSFSTDHPASEIQPRISAASLPWGARSAAPTGQPTNAEANPIFSSASSITNNEVGRAVLRPPLADTPLRTTRPADATAVRLSLILSTVWLFGALLFAGFTFWFPLRLNRQLANQHSLVNPAVREVLAECQRVMRVRRVLPVVQSQAVRGPALMGLIRPWLLLPEGMLEKFTPGELRFVFLHELAHLKRRDIAVNWLMTFLLILHWFNPLVWFAFARMRADRELACDALALSHAN
jgi:bla regulator protein BlaR1